MTKTEYEHLSNAISEIEALILVNRSLEYMVFVDDNYLTDQEKNIVDVVGLMIHATKNCDLILEKLDRISKYAYQESRTQEGKK